MNVTVSAADRASAVPQPTAGGPPPAQHPQAPANAGAAAWLVPAALLVLSAIPLAFGAFRLTQLAGGAAS